MSETLPRWTSEPETRQLRHLQTAMTEAELAVARRMQLGSNDLAAMSRITFSGQSLGPGQLAAQLGLTPGAVTELVDRLEQAGHLERHRDHADRRRVRLEPTAAAMAEVGAALTPILAALDQAVRDFDAAERDVIGRYLSAAVEAYREFAQSD